MKLVATHPVHLVLGLGLWFAWFCAVYAGVSVACAVAPPAPELGARNAVNAGLLLVTLLATALLAWAAWACARQARQLPSGNGPQAARERFVATAAAALYAVAAFSTLVVGLPLLLITPCV